MDALFYRVDTCVFGFINSTWVLSHITVSTINMCTQRKHFPPAPQGILCVESGCQFIINGVGTDIVGSYAQRRCDDGEQRSFVVIIGHRLERHLSFFSDLFSQSCLCAVEPSINKNE